MEGTVNYEGSGDVFFAFYNGNEQLTEMPKKDSGLGFERAECSNGASVEWDNASWAPKVLNITKTKTKCTLYFSANAGSYSQLEEFMKKNPSMFAYDDTTEQNLRYIGKEVNNYIDIGDKFAKEVWYGYSSAGSEYYKEYSSQTDCINASNYNVNCTKIHDIGDPILWRIIGAMKNIPVIDEYGDANIAKNLTKIIRADSIGEWSWDSSVYNVNYGSGVNEWSQADIMNTLNQGAYWSKTSGECYDYEKNSKTTCDFSSTGLTKEARNKLAKVRWNTGTISYDFASSNTYNSNEKFNTKVLYEGERSNHTGDEQCASSGNNNCNDPVVRTTTWDGYIGLMYPSDYGYAVGGDVRVSCLAKTMYKWNESSPDCKNNNWLIDSTNDQWTITPVPDSGNANYVFYVTSSGQVDQALASSSIVIRPVAYLKSSVKIKENSSSDYGSENNPFVIEGVS